MTVGAIWSTDRSLYLQNCVKKPLYILQTTFLVSKHSGTTLVELSGKNRETPSSEVYVGHFISSLICFDSEVAFFSCVMYS